MVVKLVDSKAAQLVVATVELKVEMKVDLMAEKKVVMTVVMSDATTAGLMAELLVD